MADPNPFNAQYVYLATTGRKTGLAREIEIWFVEREGRIYILAEHHYKTHWVRNRCIRSCEGANWLPRRSLRK